MKMKILLVVTICCLNLTAACGEDDCGTICSKLYECALIEPSMEIVSPDCVTYCYDPSNEALRECWQGCDMDAGCSEYFFCLWSCGFALSL
jgi:hypothetical protein